MNYYEKYLKYKNKYLQLKNQIGGASYLYQRDINIPVICNYQNPNNVTVGDTYDFEGNLYDNNKVAKALIHYEITQIIGKNVYIRATTTYVFINNNISIFTGDIISPNFNILNGKVQPYTTNLATLYNSQSPNPLSSTYQIIGNGIGNVTI